MAITQNLRLFWDELKAYNTCTCGHQEYQMTMSFVMGLNESFGAIRGQILVLEPLPPLHKVFSLVS